MQRDVLRFAAHMKDELDDDLGLRAKSVRTLGRARHGLYVSYNSFQWFMQKRMDIPVHESAAHSGIVKSSGSMVRTTPKHPRGVVLVVFLWEFQRNTTKTAPRVCIGVKMAA